MDHKYIKVYTKCIICQFVLFSSLFLNELVELGVPVICKSDNTDFFCLSVVIAYLSYHPLYIICVPNYLSIESQFCVFRSVLTMQSYYIQN